LGSSSIRSISEKSEKPRSSNDRKQLRRPDRLVPQVSGHDLAVGEERRGRSLQYGSRALAAVGQANEEVVGGKQHRGADDAADQRVVVSDHRVLQRIRDEQQDNHVEYVELADLPLAGQTQREDQKGEDEQRAGNLLDRRLIEVEQIGEQGR
jgi:hypothetical protein